jgi:DNA-binding winged helix-turn-helix (wHTH) protein
LQFGEFRFDAEAPLLTRGSRALEVSPKALQVLVVLVRNAGQVVSKDDLLNLIWPEAPVEEGNLAVHIHALRRALGSGGAGVEYIETVPKRGYRFAAPLTRAEGVGTGDRCRIGECYLQQQTADGCRRAAAEYRECIKAESNEAKARVGLANTLLLRLVLGDADRSEAVPRARALLQEARQADSTSAEVSLSWSRWFCLADWHWGRAQEELDRAVALADTDETRCVAEAWQGMHMVERGEWESGLQRLRRARAACPLSPFLSRFLAEAHFLARDFSGCVEASREALRLHPHCWLLYRAIGRALTAMGEYGEARRCYGRAMLLYNGPQAGLRAELAYLDAAAGNRDRAEQFLAEAPLVAAAQIHAALGNLDRALDCLEQACESRDCALLGLKHDTRFDPLRSSGRYRRLVAHVGLGGAGINASAARSKAREDR